MARTGRTLIGDSSDAASSASLTFELGQVRFIAPSVDESEDTACRSRRRLAANILGSASSRRTRSITGTWR
jgi:hypothetical protein